MRVVLDDLVDLRLGTPFLVGLPRRSVRDVLVVPSAGENEGASCAGPGVGAPPLAMERPPSRIPPLDGLRGLAAASVLVFHVVHATAPDWLRPDLPAVPRYALGDLGVNGVACFFVLSGFLLGMPFVAALVGAGPDVDLGRYLRARVLRIFPAWWTVLLVVILVAAPGILLRPRELVLLATLQQNYDPTLLRTLVPPAWTLVIEVSFYAALPLLALAARPLVSRLPRPARAPAVGGGLLALAACSVAFQWWWLAPERLPRPDLRPLSFSLPAYADHFLLGTAGALVFLALHGRRSARVVGPVLVLLAVGAVSLGLGVYRAEQGPVSRSLVAVAFAALVLGVALGERTQVARVLTAAPLTTLGRLSYGLYLWHLPLQYAFVRLGVVRKGGAPETLWGLLVVGGSALLVAAVSYRLIEAPALRRVSRRRGRRAEAAPAAQGSGAA